MYTISSIGWGSHQIFSHLSSPPSYASPSTIPHKPYFIFNKYVNGGVTVFFRGMKARIQRLLAHHRYHHLDRYESNLDVGSYRTPFQDGASSQTHFHLYYRYLRCCQTIHLDSRGILHICGLGRHIERRSDHFL